MREILTNKIKKAPDSPGVYIMKEKSGKVIYIGKAKSLRNRLQSYLLKGLDPKGAALVGNIYDIEYKLCPSETLSLILEAGLIRKFKPKYNILLRDDKNFPWVMLSKDDFPVLSVVRRTDDRTAVYFGPYTSASLLKDALKVIRRIFPYRTCKAFPKKACMYFKINLCPAPCIGAVSKKKYAQAIANISAVLGGEVESVLGRMKKQMQKESKAFNFEKAAKLRDSIGILSSLSSSAGSREERALEGLKESLGLKHRPDHIEAFDISNIFGKQAVGSMVSFFKGFPDKDNYRRFRIKTVKGIDDYAMISEVLRRRYSRLLSEKTGLPDLVLIDGGKQHLSVACAVFDYLGLNIPLAGIAKKEEKVYSGSVTKEVNFSSNPLALDLLRSIRDEAHRFALAYHRLLRRKHTIGK